MVGIWWSVPIGWLLADAVGAAYYMLRKKTMLNIDGQIGRASCRERV